MVDAQLEVTDVLGRRLVTIEKTPFAIGRRITSDLHLPSGEVSRDHAEIVNQDDYYEIRDCGSRYGTFVNGQEVKQQRLANGDRIRLGRSGGAELVFLLGGAPRTIERSSATIADLRQVAALLEGLRALSSARVLDDVLALVLDSAIAVGGAERGFIMLANAEGELEFKLGRSRDRQTLPGLGFETSRKIPEEVFRTGEVRIESDLLDSSLADKHMGTIALGIRNVLCVPLRLVRYVDQATAPAEDRRIGVLYLDSREKGTLLANPTRAALETLAMEAAVAIENAQLYRAALEKARLEQEMRTAAEIQRALLPTRTRVGRFFDAAAEMMPCRSIGGDFFDYIDLPDGRFGFALGDVAGKGPPAALLAAMLQGTLAAQAFASAGPAATLLSVNTALVRRGIQGRFVTLFYGILGPDGRLTYCNAGHNPPLLISRAAGVPGAAAAPGWAAGVPGAAAALAWPGVRRLDRGGPIIGLFEGIGFEEETVTLEPGDSLVMFSDGVSEALNTSDEEFGDERILRSVDGLGDEAQRRLGGLFEAVSRFAGDAAQHDDVTAMVVVYRGQALS